MARIATTTSPRTNHTRSIFYITRPWVLILVVVDLVILSRGFARFPQFLLSGDAIHLSHKLSSENSMPVCRCHSFDSPEAQTSPILSHADISQLVLISALEFAPTGTRRTDLEIKLFSKIQM